MQTMYLGIQTYCQRSYQLLSRPSQACVRRQSIVYDTNKIGAQQTSSKSLTDPSPGGPIIPLPVMEAAQSYGFFLLQSSISLELTTIVTPSQQAIICP
jgi:hypothetical protein